MPVMATMANCKRNIQQKSSSLCVAMQLLHATSMRWLCAVLIGYPAEASDGGPVITM